MDHRDLASFSRRNPSPAASRAKTAASAARKAAGVYATERAASSIAARRGCSGYRTAYASEHEDGFVLVIWWGTASAPTDARVFGLGGKVFAEGVEATNAFLGI